MTYVCIWYYFKICTCTVGGWPGTVGVAPFPALVARSTESDLHTRSLICTLDHLHLFPRGAGRSTH